MTNTYQNTLKIAGGLLATAIVSGTAFGQSADALIDKLVDKGVLNTDEAKALREEADKDFTRAYSVKSGMPEWVTAFKLNGDVRLRYENLTMPDEQERGGSNTATDRNRFRYRLRFGATASFFDNMEAGFRLTSSEGGDPISGNTSFDGNGDKDSIYLDLVYAKWKAINNADWNLTLTGGKMENPFVFSDMVFDKDYTPEGGAVQLNHLLDDKHTLKLIGSFFVANEMQYDSNDSYMFLGQLRWDAAWNPKWQSTVGAAWVGLKAEENLATSSAGIQNKNQGNTRTATGGNLVYDYNPFILDASITHTLENFWMYNAPFPIRLEADYINNPAAPRDNYGWQAGFTLGKSGKRGLYDLSYRYKYLGADAWYEEVVDSDFGAYYGAAPAGGAVGYGSGANVRGHIIKLQYSPFDSTTLAVTYFLTDLINEYAAAGASKDSNVGRLQVDVSWKF